MVQQTSWTHETVLPAEPVSAAKARDFVCQHLLAHDHLRLVEDVRLVVSELATNALLHARTSFVVALSETDGIVSLTIRDGSTSFPVRTTPEVWDMGGRGLLLVELLSHEWGASVDGSGHKSVWASFSA